MKTICTTVREKEIVKRLPFTFFGKIPVALLLLMMSSLAWSQRTVPFAITNNSTFADNDIFVAVVGKNNRDEHVWIDGKTGAIRLMNTSDNTIQGPVSNGDQGPGGSGKYADCFARLSEIPGKTINIPAIGGCRILLSFKSQLYLYFFGPTGGYAAPNLANANDPNQGVRFEMIELTNAPNGLWANTTRVDSYQYPMGLEVWGDNNFYKKVGELKTHDQILAQWKSTAPGDYQACLDASKGIIKFPSKNPIFQEGGAQGNYFKAYIDAIWSKYSSAELAFNAGDAGIWRGRVSGEVFTFTRTSDGAVAKITRRPNTQEAMEGSGVLAEGGQWDKVVQAQLCAAINRHALDLNIASGVTQDWSNDSQYYITSPYNWYCKFWHQTDISFNSLTYSFCYDDVFDKSSTINALAPTRALITIGGFAGSAPEGVATVYKHCNFEGTSVSLPAGDYTLSQLNARGILNKDISSLRVDPGYQVQFYNRDNFTGRTIVYKDDNSCLVGDVWNDSTTSLKVAVATAHAPTVSITSPSNNASFTAPASVKFSVDAKDNDGTISKVEFFNGSTSIGSSSIAPFNFTWNGVRAGTYVFTAKAIDNSGLSGTSSAVTIVVKSEPGNQAPTVSITSPSNNANFNAPASITIGVNAHDIDGTVSRVEYFNGTTSIGSSTTSPYSFTWSSVAAGTYIITAKATDNAGASSTSAAITVTVNTVSNDGCLSVSQFIDNGGYVDGSIVKNLGNRYQCKPYPFTGWCNIGGWAYTPGTGTYWQDAWILLGSCSTTAPQNAVQGTASSIDTKTLVSPNPTSDDVQIHISENVVVDVYSLQGYLMVKEAHVTANGVLSLRHLPTGPYTLVIRTKTGVIRKNILRQQ